MDKSKAEFLVKLFTAHAMELSDLETEHRDEYYAAYKALGTILLGEDW